MNRIIRNFSLSLLVVAAVTGFGLVTSCNITGVGPSGATGGLNLLLTDGPTDDWQEVTVVLKSVSLHSREGNSWEDVWAADPANPASGTVNLVDLSGVTAILEKAMIPVGTYNLLKLVIDTDPATMTLVDDLGTPIAPSQITVVAPSRKGEIKIDLSPAITVAEGSTTNLLVDFDLAHPLSIVNLGGKVVVSLYARRVWYATSVDTLPQFTPEGLVRRVGENWLRILKKRTEALSTGGDRYRCDWNSETVFVDENTTWTSLQPAALEPRFQTEVPPLPLSLLPGLYRLSNAVCRPQERPCSICSKYLDGSPPCGLDLLCSARLLVLQGLFGSSLRLSTCDGSFV